MVELLSMIAQALQVLPLKARGADRRMIAEFIGSMSTDSPVLSYFPLKAAEQLSSAVNTESVSTTGMTSSMRQLLQCEAPLFWSF